ncbi:hypothetical protein BDA99DRAFT_498220 [Phascolomyces articulosus]|uniref:Uncharacterized protein n=1 Tax=Phascolomyces articulosus TaxID=60185 RepID=A0AAD5KLI4_9FUNG|nr:hypothetical protein BDA99DRAFT_498220 [Phascolomyces articulosus]
MNEDGEQQQQQQQNEIDPLLTPGELRQIVDNLPSRMKHPHSDYEYSDTSDFETEIEEFFNYSEVENELKSCQQEFEANINFDWCRLNEKEQERHIELTLDRLEHSVRDERLSAAKQLLCITLGCCHNNNSNSSKSQNRSEVAIANNRKMYKCGALTAVFHAFNRACKQHDTYDSQNPGIEELSIVSNEIGLYISIMYIILEAIRTTNGFSDENGMLDSSILRSLFDVVSQLRDKYLKSFPVKKLILLLWKTLLSTFGGLEELQYSKNASRILHGLDPSNTDIISKCTPQDLYTFQNEATLKYPNYAPPEIPLPITPSLTVKASPRLVQAMGISNATAHTELPYQTLFPPKSSSNSSNSSIKSKQQQNLSMIWPPPQSQSFVLPLDKDSPGVPQSTAEAGNLYLKNMYMSVANQQIFSEREKSIHKWEQMKEKIPEFDDLLFKCENNEHVTVAMKKRFEALEQIYTSIVPDLQNIVIVLLKLLLSTVTTAANGVSSKQQQNSNADRSLNNTSSGTVNLDEADSNRNREVLSKAISGILLLLLKWTKVSHVLKFEYLSQLLVDSGCLLLILKILGLQEITALVAAETNIDGYSMFQKNMNDTSESILSEPSTSHQQPYTNCRNMFWTINFLRILQMLTKRKTNRVMLLVQYKSSAILKRVLKVSHPMMEVYALKVLKSQVPYLGRKWRSLNMRIISAIYLRCYTVLRDDWISKSDTDNDLEDGMIQETNLRMLIRIYHGQRYIHGMLPEQDEPSGLDGLNNTIQNTASSSILDSNFSILDGISNIKDSDIDLDPEFVENYEEWLQKNVYDSDSPEDDNDNNDYYTYYSSDNAQKDNPVTPGTPIPSSPIVAPYMDEPPTHNIHNFYKQGLEEVFSTDQMLVLPGYDDDDESLSDPYLNPMQKLSRQLLAAEQRTIQQYSDITEDSNSSLSRSA